MTWETADLRPLTGARWAGNDGLAWRVATDQGQIQVDFPAPQTARIAFTPTGAPPHQTWSLNGDVLAALAPLATQTDDMLHLRGGDGLLLTVTLPTTGNALPLGLALARGDGSVVIQEALGLGMAPDSTLGWQTALMTGEMVYGGGLRTGRLNKRGRRLTLWSSDPLPDHNDQTDMMYQSVTFFIGLRADGQAYGIFYDSNWKALADIGATTPEALTFLTTGPDLVAYLFAGPTLADVLAQYTALTGRIPPVARWSLGNQQSRWSYMSAAEVRAIAQEFRDHEIPCDAIYCDIDYMRSFRDFTWDPERFPNPAALTDDLRAQGMRLVTIIDPGVKVDPEWEVYRDGLEHGYYVRHADGTPFQGWVWPGLSAWADFARPEVRAWWGAQHAPLIQAGVAGIWDDMNEPTQSNMMAPPEVNISFGSALPLDSLHGPIDQPIPHAAFHNAYGTQMARATREGLEEQRPDERAFVLTRAAGAGAQRFAIVWNGDNSSLWSHVSLGISLNLGIGLSGFPVSGFDIGGFWHDTTPELLVRFTQVGAFMPLCRNHTAKNTIAQEPWAFGEPYTSVNRAAITQRYRLLPYLITLARTASATGSPMVRPLTWLAPTDPSCRDCDDQFLLGDDLLIAPVVAEGATERTVILPPGSWFSWLDGTVVAGPIQITLPVHLTTVPVFARAGAILPVTAPTQTTSAPPAGPLTFEAHLAGPGTIATGTAWDDDDHPQAEQRGTYAQYAATARWEDDMITFQIEQVGGSLPLRYPGVRAVVRLPAGYQATMLDAAESMTLPLTCRLRVHQEGDQHAV